MQLRRTLMIVDCGLSIVGSATAFYFKGQRRLSSTSRQSKLQELNP